MNRVDDLDANTLPQFLDRMESDLVEMKSTYQRIGGASVQQVITESANQYDWSGVLPNDPSGGPGIGFRVLKVTAISSKMENLYGSLTVKMFVGSPTNWYRPSNFLADVDVGSTGFLLSVSPYVVNLDNRQEKSFLVWITGDDSTTIYLKYYVIASDSVTFSTSVIT